MHRKLLLILVLSILVIPTLIGCDGGQSTPLLIVFSITGGNVSVMKAGTGSWAGAQCGMSLEVGDTIRSSDNSNAEIICFEGTTIELQAGAEIEIASLSITNTGSTTIVLKQTIGSIIFRVTRIIDSASRYEVQTPAATVALRGSATQVSVIENGTTWACNLEGDIWAIAQGVELQIPQGMCCVINPGQPPELIMQTSELDRASTPTTEDYVLASNSMIMDCAIGDDGEVAYAIVETEEASAHLLKSDDYAATWDDITDPLEQVDDLNYINPDGGLLRVETDGTDANFVAVAVWENSEVRVYFSNDGGTTFNDAGEVEDSGVHLDMVADLVVSPESSGRRDIAIGGTGNSTYGAGLFRCIVTGDSPGPWQDVTDYNAYEGWDNMWPSDVDTDDIHSWLVTDIIFSPSWPLDKTVLVTTVADDYYGYQGVYLQCGSWGTTPGWNSKSTLGIDAVPIQTDNTDDIEIPIELVSFDARLIAGMTLPEDYYSTNASGRYLWVWVNYYDPDTSEPACIIMRVEDDIANPVVSVAQIEFGQVFLTNISYKGTIAQGEAIAGVLGEGGYPYGGEPTDLFTACCEGVQVYRHDGIFNMDICCEPWHDACKPPTGRFAMAVTYVGDDKAYAVGLQGDADTDDEGAWSVTFDDGDTWNQLSLVDTDIDYLSDVAVSRDSNKTMLVSGSEETGCGCDSVWLRADLLTEAHEYSDKWLRTWCGKFEGDEGAGLLRLAPEETTGDTVYLVDHGTSNVYWNNLETLACWDFGFATVDYVIDLAVKDESTIYALDYYGDVAMSDDYVVVGWYEPVDSKVDYGWTIAVWGDYVLVGGQDGDVSYSDDGGETFVALEDIATSGTVTVAFDNDFDSNHAIYAALGDAGDDDGIYRWVIDESTEWENLCA